MASGRRHAGEVFGAYTLIESLGAGGNAEVWKATTAGRDVALKLLRRYRRDEPYARFKREVQQLQTLGDEPGVLPYLDSSLPDHPSLSDPPWLAMPVATPLPAALGPTADAEAAVAAIAAIAATLAALHARGISHRDIKPDNLYRHEGRWSIGDFGLVDAPDVEPLTDGANNLGPRHYLAPEMINEPATAAGAAADVYSLGKTLWVLLTGQRFPPPGEHRFDIEVIRVSAYRPGPDIHPLDLLLEAMTRYDPNRRPSAQTVASDLADWRRTPSPLPAPADLSTLARRAALAVRDTQAESDRRLRRKLAVDSLMAELSKRAAEVGKRCRANGLPVADRHRSPHGDYQFDASSYVAETLGVLATQSAAGDDPPETQAGSMMIQAHADTPALSIWIATSAIPRNEPDVLIVAGAKIITTNARVLETIWTKQRRFVLDGPAQAVALAELVAEMLTRLPDDVRRWVAAVERHTAARREVARSQAQPARIGPTPR